MKDRSEAEFTAYECEDGSEWLKRRLTLWQRIKAWLKEWRDEW